ncbi:MAG: YigZ family protein [Clostridioides sp.]|jgi:uncharacterized YigZ family protein|nr:YigZ family protein [Clostridioides sp.]
MKKSNYKTIHRFGTSEYEIEKSRFIGYAKPVQNEEEAVAFINEIKQKHKDATHNVWAYVLGQTMNVQRYSDDGEPQGTAGIPTLEVIKKSGLTDVVVVVTRYFGGVKLGAGGLVRAYTTGAKIGLESGMIVDKVVYQSIKVMLDYTLLGKVQNFVSNVGYYIKDVDYTDSVDMNLYIKIDEVEKVSSELVEITNGKVEIRLGDEFYVSEKDGKIIE